MENQINNHQPSHKGKTITGIILLGLGLYILLNNLDFVLFPHWLFRWPLITIAVGLYIGTKSNFKKTNWIFITAIGVLFLLPNIISSFTFGLLWPLFMIALGVTIYTRRGQRWNGDHWEKRDNNQYQAFDNKIK